MPKETLEDKRRAIPRVANFAPISLEDKMNSKVRRWRVLFLLLLLLCSRGCSSRRFGKDSIVGVNYGRLGSNLPTYEVAVKLITSLKIRNVKLFDMDQSALNAFANTNISLSVCIPNGEIPSLASDPSKAYHMIRQNILPFYPRTKITSISVGTEVSMLPEFGLILLPAMKAVYNSLLKFKLHRRIQVSTPQSLAILAIRFPPSKAVFQESIAEPVLRPILEFLDQTNSSFMVNLYPYLTFKETPFIPMDFATFTAHPKVFNFADEYSGLLYTNLFDMLVDALNSAAASLGFHNLPLVVTETGWPSEGSPDDAAASIQNAAIFNERLVEHITKSPTKGTPLKPGVPVPTFIFSLFDEDLKPGAPTEKHWGLFYANGTIKYNLTVSRKHKGRIIRKFLPEHLPNASMIAGRDAAQASATT